MAEQPTFNIVQAEFLHSPVDKADTVDELIGAMGRMIDRGESLKSAIRFYDEKGLVTKLVQEFATTDQDVQTLVQIDSSGKEVLDLFNSASKKLAGKRIRLRGQARSLVIGQLSAIIKGTKQVAVELPDRSFRVAASEELPGILERARTALSTSLFVFTPNDLCSDSNDLVGHMR